jgi:hypothetical protein
VGGAWWETRVTPSDLRGAIDKIEPIINDRKFRVGFYFADLHPQLLVKKPLFVVELEYLEVGRVIELIENLLVSGKSSTGILSGMVLQIDVELTPRPIKAFCVSRVKFKSVVEAPTVLEVLIPPSKLRNPSPIQVRPKEEGAEYSDSTFYDASSALTRHRSALGTQPPQ